MIIFEIFHSFGLLIHTRQKLIKSQIFICGILVYYKFNEKISRALFAVHCTRDSCLLQSLSVSDDSGQCSYRSAQATEVSVRRAAMPVAAARSHGQLHVPCDELDGCELESVRSYGSSGVLHCDHPHVAHNGTTFSGRRMRYVVHCSAHAGQVGDDYLTPTQRAQRQIRRLKQMLGQVIPYITR